MGFHRQGMPAALNRAQATAVVTRIYAEELAHLRRTADPFLVENDCLDPAGHDFIPSCGRLVCPHCSRIFA